MPYQPTSPYPYLNTIDVTQDVEFMCAINPRDCITKYHVNIIDNRSGETVLSITEDNNTLTYKGKSSAIGGNEIDGYHILTMNITDTARFPVYGTQGNETMLTIPIPKNYILDKSDEHHDTADESRLYGDYVWNITLYHDTESVVSTDYFFKIRDSADIIVFNNDKTLNSDTLNTINSGDINISVKYSQPQNILPAYYCFNLKLGNNTIYTTENIVSSNIFFKYDSLISGNSYTLELIICDDEGNQTINEYDLYVNYAYFLSVITPEASFKNNECWINVNYSQSLSIYGKYDTNEYPPLLVTYMTTETSESPEHSNAVCIPTFQYVEWSDKSNGDILDLDNTSQVFNWHGHPGFDGVIFEKSEGLVSSTAIIVGHDISQNITHADNSLIYIDGSDTAMPVGIETNDIKAGFYYQFGRDEKKYISEFSKISSAIYKTLEQNIETAVAALTPQIAEDTLYILNDEDEISETNILIENDTTYRNWWTIGILDNSVVVYKSSEYTEMEVDA